MYVRYKLQCKATVVGSGSATYSADMPNIFLEWNQEDPVSQYELNRNTVLQTMQGNRNPFIDNPYLATLIWNGPAAQDTWGLLSEKDFAQNNVYAYPTLTTGKVFIMNTNDIKYNYTVFNSLGQQVKAHIVDNEIDLTGNSAGIYFLNINNENTVKTYRLILQ
jgi:hypothetical protein